MMYVKSIWILVCSAPTVFFLWFYSVLNLISLYSYSALNLLLLCSEPFLIMFLFSSYSDITLILLCSNLSLNLISLCSYSALDLVLLCSYSVLTLLLTEKKNKVSDKRTDRWMNEWIIFLGTNPKKHSKSKLVKKCSVCTEFNDVDNYPRRLFFPQ